MVNSDALGFAPFGFDGPQNATGEYSADFENLGKCYAILVRNGPVNYHNYGSDRLRGLGE